MSRSLLVASLLALIVSLVLCDGSGNYNGIGNIDSSAGNGNGNNNLCEYNRCWMNSAMPHSKNTLSHCQIADCPSAIEFFHMLLWLQSIRLNLVKLVPTDRIHGFSSFY